MILSKDELRYVRSKGRIIVMGVDYVTVKTKAGTNVRLGITQIKEGGRKLAAVAEPKAETKAETKAEPKPASTFTTKPVSVFEEQESLKEEQKGLEHLLAPKEETVIEEEYIIVTDVTPKVPVGITEVEKEPVHVEESVGIKLELADVHPAVKQDIAPRVQDEPVHATLAPSSMYMFKSCYMSLVPLEHPLPERPSIYAAEGTAAHELLKEGLTQLTYPKGTLESAIEVVKAAIAEELVEGMMPFDDEMRQHVIELLVIVDRLIGKIGRECILSFLVEDKVKFSENIYGTIDFGILYVKDNKKKIYALDLKYGKGKAVRAENNEQLLTYILAIKEDRKWDATEAIAAIYQPRNREEVTEDLDVWQIDLSTLKKGKRELKRFETRALKILAGTTKAKEKYGDHCTWCKRKAVCKTYAKQARVPGMLELNRAKPLLAPKQPNKMTDEQLDFVCRNAEHIIGYVKAVETYVAARCATSNPLKGWKLVAGKSIRQWLENIEEVGAYLIEKGVSDPYKKSLIGIGEVEKIIGKKKELLDPVTFKSPPKPKLVTDEDPRPALTNNAADMLTCLDEDEDCI